VTDDQRSDRAGAGPAGDDGARPFVFDRMHRILRRRMPTLELIHERFARTARLALFNMIRRSVEVHVHAPEVKPYEEFMRGFPERTNINLVNIRPLRGVGCWIVDPQVVFIAIDNMFGGEGKLEPRVEIKEYTATELRIIRRLVDGLLNEYEKAWKPVYEIKFDFMRQETSFQFARITEPDEMVLHSRFTIDINGREGNVELCIPFWVLEPVKTLLSNQMQSFQMEEDSQWTKLLEGEVQSAQVKLVAELARREMTVGEVLSLNVGEILPIEVLDPVTVYVDGLPVIHGKYGVRNGRYAVRIESIRHPADFLKNPLSRGLLGPSGASPVPDGEG
jgi:flagellar motor switch protein FliM